MLKKLTPDELREICDESTLPFKSTEQLTPLTDIIGQERAVRAMEFGLKINRKGYNIFMTGLTGTGKTSYARSVVSRFAQGKPIPDDIIYVYNFSRPEKPMVINLPAGKGSEISKDMEKLISDIREEISRAFNDESFVNQRQEIIDRYQKISMEQISQLDVIAKAQGFALQKTSQGIVTIPLSDTKPMSQEEFETLDDEKKKVLEQKSQGLQSKIDEAIRKVRTLDKLAKKELDELERNTALSTINPLFEEMILKYKSHEKIIDYLKSVKSDFITNLMILKEDKKKKEEGSELVQLFNPTAKSDIFLRYKVNLFVDNKATPGAPIVFETNPTYYNLFGKIEGKAQFGTIVTDFTVIRSGAIHRANGGYLVLQAQDLFKEPFAWDALKRALSNGESRVENIGQEYRSIPTVTLKPQPIPIDVKIILIGTPYIYSLLNTYDEDFKKLFKIKVDFDIEMDRNPTNIKKYAALICKTCRTQNLLHFDSCSVARVIDYSSRLAEDKTKLSTRFNEILEVLYESSTWAELDGSDIVTKEHVEKAISEKIYRSNRIEERILSMIKKGEILVDTEGAAVGQVNGLSVLDAGDYVFGQPSRITTKVYLGDAGVVNIEREAKMSGL
ncbi:MAG: AAA family ATPase [Tepidanaerobacteraceae bacterium]|nr:AAA family ATPase [Tepidanaerobacteraceae bacterium]